MPQGAGAGSIVGMLNTELIAPAVSELAAALTGDVVSPADSEWDLARRAWNLAATSARRSSRSPPA